MINDEIAQEIMHELFSSLEALETQSAAILRFLKDKGIASEEELAVHFEQAGNASSVRWRAARVRMDHLLSSVVESATQEAPRLEQPKSSEKEQKPAANTTRKTGRKREAEASSEAPSKAEPERETQATDKVAASGESDKEKPKFNTSEGKNRNQESDRQIKSPEHAANSDTSEDAPSRKIA